MFILDLTVSALCEFFLRAVPRLPVTYKWKTPPIEGFCGSGRSGYQANIELKRHLTEQWKQSLSGDRLELARVIVSKWGGIRGNRPDTLRRYVDAISMADPPTPLKGIASYSKIFSIAQPDRFAIYDARVAACLNAIQVNAGLAKGIAFNYVPGRNNIVGNVATKRGFTQNPKFSVRSLRRSGWTGIKRDETYAKYLETLSRCLTRLQRYELVELEMALFSNAECECQLVIDRRNGPNRLLQRTLAPSPTVLPRRSHRFKCR